MSQHGTWRSGPLVGVIGTRGFPNTQGGVEKHCEELYPRLAAAGMRVIVFSRSPYVAGQRTWTRWRGVLLRKLWAPRKRSFEAICHSFIALLQAHRYRVEVLHFHAVGPGLLVPLARLLGFRVVFTHHGFDYNRGKWGRLARLILRLGEWCAVHGAHEVLSVSQGIARSLERRFGTKVRLAPNGVAPNEMHLADASVLTALGARSGEYAITVARLVPEKGWDVLFQAMQDISRIHLLGVGGADQESPYAKRLLANAPRRVRMLGMRPHDVTLRLVQDARVFVLPSFHEGMPIALLEALALGTLVVASDIEPHREVVKHGENGFLFRVGDGRSLADTLLEVWDLVPERRAYVRRNAQQTVAREYSWSRTVEIVSDAYRTVVSVTSN